jgi:rfaE bifunctional protein kinase chain/domain
MKNTTRKSELSLSAFCESTRADQREANEWLDRLASPRVLIVGDLMLDEYVVGDCDRISPEAPVPVVRVHTRQVVLGGAGNVAANIAALGGIPEIVATVGINDGMPDAVVRTKLAESGISDRGLVPVAERPTIRKTRLFSGIHQVARFDEEVSTPLSKSKAAEIVRLATARVPDVDVIVLSDYRKGVLTPIVIAEIIRSAADYGVPVIVDPKGEDFSRYLGATLVTPNAREARIAAEVPPDSENWNLITSQLLRLAEVDAVAVTCGAAGIVIRGREDPRYSHRRTLARPVFDVIGAGDTVAAAFAIGLGSGLDFVAVADLANLAAGVVVMKPGTSTVSREELVAATASVPQGG